jgi:hypothetical protein
MPSQRAKKVVRRRGNDALEKRARVKSKHHMTGIEFSPTAPLNPKAKPLFKFPILITPLLRHSVLLLLRVRNLSPSLDFTLEHHVAEPIFEEIALRFEEAKGVAKFIWKNDFERGFGEAVGMLVWNRCEKVLL